MQPCHSLQGARVPSGAPVSKAILCPVVAALSEPCLRGSGHEQMRKGHCSYRQWHPCKASTQEQSDIALVEDADALISERGTSFITGKAFYRVESAQGRDLAVLCASLHRQRSGTLRVLDVMAGSGVRGARYLSQAGADEVWCNDYNPSTHNQLVTNLCSTVASMSQQHLQQHHLQQQHLQQQQQQQDMATTQGPPSSTTSGTTTTTSGASSSTTTTTSNGVRHPLSQADTHPGSTNSTAPGLPEAEASHSSSTASATGTLHPQAEAAGHDGAVRSQQPTTQQEMRAAVQQWEQSASVHTPPGLRRQVWQWQAELLQPALTRPQTQGTSQQGLPSDARIRPEPAQQPLAAGTSPATQPHAAGDISPEPPPHAAGGTSHPPQQHAAGGDSPAPQPHAPGASHPPQPGHRTVTTKVSHMDAKRLLAACYLNEDFYDLIDLDSFGSDSSFLGNAIDAVQYGGLLYLTSTDGFSAGGRRPLRALAAYGCYTRALPFANEQGLRMLIGAAVKEGAARGVALTPVYSLFSYHGPVFRVMLRAKRSAEWPLHHYKFVGHCHVHGSTAAVDWQDLGSTVCRVQRCISGTSHPLVVAGPMWTGPLHNRADILDMMQEATRLGWSGHSPDTGLDDFAASARTKKNGPKPLEDMLQIMLEESDERLPPGFTQLDVLGRYLASYPPRDKLITELRGAGHAAARCHLDAKSIRTNASMEHIVAAGARLGIARRADCPW